MACKIYSDAGCRKCLADGKVCQKFKVFFCLFLPVTGKTTNEKKSRSLATRVKAVKKLRTWKNPSKMTITKKTMKI